MNTQDIQPIAILLVDNDPDCRLLLGDALRECGIPIDIHEAASGEEALQFLLRRGEFSAAPQVNLIYLDVEMPGGINGLETLRRIRTKKELRDVPVVMMTGVCGEEQMREAAALGANSYTLKPADSEQFMGMVRISARYWLGIHQYPQHHLSRGVCRGHAEEAAVQITPSAKWK